MAGKVKGITLEVGGNTEGLNRALEKSKKESRSLQSELRQVEQTLRMNPGNVDLIRQKEVLLRKELENQRKKLTELKAAKAQADAAMREGTEVNQKGYRELEREIARTEAAIKKCSAETQHFEKEGSKLDKFKEKFSNLKSGVISSAAEIGKAAAKGTVAAGAAVTATLAAAVKAAGELEQNMGGSEAVFKQHAESMQKTAEEAYTKLGLSQSDYLATANKMGALFQGSGFSVDESVEMTTKAMQTAADVASIMGIDVKDAMEAVAGAAKGNFTMMDNLGVAMNDTTLQAYAQEKGLGKLETTHDKVGAAMQMFSEKAAYAAGNYEKENATIAGSLTTLKASLQNFISGSGDTGQVVKSIENAGKVIIDNVKTLAPKITTGLKELIISVVPKIPGMITEFLPFVIEGTAEVISGLITVLPDLLAGLVKAVPAVLASLFSGADILLSATRGQSELGKAVDKNAEKVEQVADKLENLNKEYEQSVSAAKEATAQTLAEIEADKNLLGELESISDENGKVKEGYEDRANYIFNELNSAYDTEYSLIDGVISKNGEAVRSYAEVKTAIEKNMEASRAAVIMKEYEEEYAAAVKRTNEAQKSASEASKNYGEALETRKTLISDVKERLYEFYTASETAKDAYEFLEQAITEGQSWTSLDTQGAYSITNVISAEEFETWQKNEENIKKCREAIGEYSAAYEELSEIEGTLNEARALSADGENRKIVDSYSLTAEEIQHINEQNTQAMKDDIDARAAGIEALKGTYAEALEAGNTLQAEALKELIETAVTNLTTLETEYRNAGGKAGQALKDGFKEEAAPEKMAAAAKNSGQGLLDGLTPFETMLYNKGLTLAASIHTGYNAFMVIKSPSRKMKEAGKNTMQGLINGLDEHTKDLVKLAEETGEEELELTKFYASEKQRLEDEEFDKEYNQKIKDAKTAEEAEKIKQEYIEKAQKEGQDEYLEALKAAADYEKKQYDEQIKAAETFRNKIEKIFEGLKNIFGADDDFYREYTVKTKDGTSDTWYELADFEEMRKKVEDYAAKLQNLQTLLPSAMFDKIRDLNMEKGGIVADLLLALDTGALSDKINEWDGYQSSIETSAANITAPFLEDESNTQNFAGLSQAILNAWENRKSGTVQSDGRKSVLVTNNFYTSPQSPAEVSQEMTSALKRESLLI